MAWHPPRPARADPSSIAASWRSSRFHVMNINKFNELIKSFGGGEIGDRIHAADGGCAIRSAANEAIALGQACGVPA
ncbi:MAG TPA: hypothetical protein VFX03_01845 [Thermomicrobiales bacterium]|nr:hypothetical protein [Thermomicrobiales bacterium]